MLLTNYTQLQPTTTQNPKQPDKRLLTYAHAKPDVTQAFYDNQIKPIL